jgi:hypothetical protein
MTSTNACQVRVIPRPLAPISAVASIVPAILVGKVTAFILASIQMRQCVKRSQKSARVKITVIVCRWKSRRKFQHFVSVQKAIAGIQGQDNVTVGFLNTVHFKPLFRGKRMLGKTSQL